MIRNNLTKKLVEFRKQRDWEQFHKPKEVALMLNDHTFEHVCEEIADIAIYLTCLCNDLGVDINEVILKKLEANRKKIFCG